MKRLWNKYAPPPPHDVARELGIEQIVLLHRSLPYSAAVTCVNSLVCCAFLYFDKPGFAPVAWLALFNLLAAYQLFGWWRNRNRPRPSRPSERHARRTWQLASIQGLTWGLFVAFNLPGAAPDTQLVLAIVVVGMAAGATVAFVSHPLAAVGYLTGATLPATALFIAYPTSLTIALAVFSATYYAFLLFAVRFGHAALIHSITLQLRNQTLLETARDANRSKAEMIAQFGHELRTPLNSIIGFADLMREEQADLADGDHREYAEFIRGSGTHLLRLIDNILDSATEEARGREMEFTLIDPSVVVDAAVLTVTQRARRKGQTITDNTIGDLEAMADETALRQIFVNLLSNAVKYTQKGGHIFIDQARAEDGGVIYRVRDNGPGVPKRHLERVMEPFFRLDHRATGQEAEAAGQGKQGSQGLGLSICRTLAQLHDGSLHLESDRGQGLTAVLCLPGEAVTWRDAETAPPAEPAATETVSAEASPAAATNGKTPPRPAAKDDLVPA